MLAMKLIEPAQTKGASPIGFVPRKEGTLRFSVDYRRRNAVTTRDSYPLRRVNERIESLGDGKIFSTLDANTGYCQVEVHKSNHEKTAFTSNHGLYQFTRISFGLSNAPLHFNALWTSYCQQPSGNMPSFTEATS